jgi:polar amino acid transport system substrate-binding protein
MSDNGLSRRQYLTTIGGTAVTLSVAGCSGDTGSGEETDAQTITAGTAPGFPPFEMKEDGELVGFDIDLLEAVIGQTDYTLSGWEEFEFDSLIPALNNNNIDVIAAGMTINDDRDQTIDFTDPYYTSNQAVVVRSDDDFSPEGLSDLADSQIGAQSGTTGEGVVQDELVGDEISESQYSAYGNYVLAIEDLENGNTDAVMIDVPVAETFAANRPVEVAFVYETDEEFGFGVRSNADNLASSLNSGLSTVQDDGTYEELTAEWFAE